MWAVADAKRQGFLGFKEFVAAMQVSSRSYQFLMHAIPSCNEVHRVVMFWIRRISCLFHNCRFVPAAEV